MNNKKYLAPLIGGIILTVLLLLIGNFGAALNLLGTIFLGIKTVFIWVWKVFIGFLPYWELDDWTICFTIFCSILFVGSICGTVYSAKRKNKLWMTICSVFDVISLGGTIISFVSLK